MSALRSKCKKPISGGGRTAGFSANHARTAVTRRTVGKVPIATTSMATSNARRVNCGRGMGSLVNPEIPPHGDPVAHRFGEIKERQIERIKSFRDWIV